METTGRNRDRTDDQDDYIEAKDDDYPLVASPPAHVVMEEPKTGFTRVAVTFVTLLLLSAAWGVVALSMYIIVRVLTGQGFSQNDALLIAAPAVIVPLWKTVGVLQQGSLERVLVGQLWILNGGVVWGLIVLGAVWWINVIRDLMEGGTSGFMLALAAAGFVPLVSFLYFMNAWILRRWQR